MISTKIINSKLCYNLLYNNRFYHKSLITVVKNKIIHNDILINKEVSRTKLVKEPIKSFHKRPLPTSLISLSSIQGKQLFTEALLQGGLNSYFPLAEQFVTQSEPSFCSLSSLSMVLNALNFDPKKVWKGAWRWINEETLLCESTQICGHSLEKIKENGMNFKEFETLGRCHGVRISSFQAQCSTQDTQQCVYNSFERFQHYIETISKDESGKSFMVINFSRKVLGDGHFSPIAGYHPEKGLVLVLDVARFKYPPYWVSIETIWQAMNAIDLNTNTSRGYFIISGWDDLKDDDDQMHIHNHNNNSITENYSNNIQCLHHNHQNEHDHEINISSNNNATTCNNSNTTINNSNTTINNSNTTINNITIDNSTNKSKLSNHLHNTSIICQNLILRNNHINSSNHQYHQQPTSLSSLQQPINHVTTQDTTNTVVQPNTIKAVCPPRIRTWQDVKKSIPSNNQCCMIKNNTFTETKTTS